MASPAGAERDALISQFCDVTGTNPSRAEAVLATSGWDVETAISHFYSMQEGPERDDPDNDYGIEADAAFGQLGQPSQPTASAPAPAYPSGGRTLGGGPPPPDASSSSGQPSTARRQPQRGLRTLRDLQSDSGGHGHSHDDDDGDDEQDQDMFAGGEKSGLAVHNPKNPTKPRDHIERIIKKAREDMAHPESEEDEPQVSRFRGAGQTLGGDDTPSRMIPDPNANRPRARERVQRVLHLWRDGFSVDDGPLYRFDDPANAETLAMIHQGRAPLSLLDVEEGQPVELQVDPRPDEDFVQPKKKYKPFSGAGQRLGSPVPGVSSSATASSSATVTAAPSATSSSAGAAAQPPVAVDDSQPAVTLQVRLGDGTQLRSRFNTTHTIGDVYGFVDAASPTSRQRTYALMTTFPSRELSDRSAALANVAELKRGGVVVQKWK